MYLSILLATARNLALAEVEEELAVVAGGLSIPSSWA